MTSNEIKTKVLYYFRFSRGFKYIATEVPPFNADVLVSDGKRIVECEVKTSIADLKSDFKKKKHRIYQSPSTGWHFLYRPNKMFYALPQELVAKGKLIIPKAYGVISVKDTPIKNGKNNDFCSIARNADSLALGFNDKLFHRLELRCSSELMRLRLSLHAKQDQARRILQLYRRNKVDFEGF